jgi:hypothetical protein
MLEQYIDYTAMAEYYISSERELSRDNDIKAKKLLNIDWKNRISNGQFIVYWFKNSNGDRCPNAQGVLAILQDIVLKNYPYIFDFERNLTENQLKLTSGKTSALYGITGAGTGPIKGIEKIILSSVWGIDRYWVSTPTLSISRMKNSIEKAIEKAFEQTGNISIRELYLILEEDYGFAPSNLSAFIAGFLLKEYANDPYRASDSMGSTESMRPDKMAEMLGNYIGNAALNKYKDTYIVKMTADEMAFYDLTEKAWDIKPNSMSSTDQAARAVEVKMRSLGLPIWCLADIDDYDIFEIVEKYIEVVKKEGREAHQIAVEIGKIARGRPNLAENLSRLLTKEKCQKGILSFLKGFEGGSILVLAKEIGAKDLIVEDIRKVFEDVKHSWLWDEPSGKEQIKQLAVEYSIVKESNGILNVNTNSLETCFKNWRDGLNFTTISWEAVKSRYPKAGNLFDYLFKVYQNSEILPEALKIIDTGLKENRSDVVSVLHNEQSLFIDIYNPYLDGFDDKEIVAIKSKLRNGMFSLSKTECNSLVKSAAEEFRKEQKKTQLFSYWEEKTGSKNPRDWSKKEELPILCLVETNDFDKAKKFFDILNRSYLTEIEINTAFDYLKKTKIFSMMGNEDKKADAFKKCLLGKYRYILTDIKKVKNKLSRLSIDPYDWLDNPRVKQEIENYALAEYNAGGSDKVLKTIDDLDDKKVKQYLKKLIKENIRVGMEIMAKETGE